MAILGHLGTTELERALLHQERHLLVRVPGVGPKLADRLLHELKGKTLERMRQSAPEKQSVVSAATPKTEHAQVLDVVAALMQLGYKKYEAEEASFTAIKEADASEDSVALIKRALAYAAKKEKA
jgi:Holliday junction DNA helicase RuvA